MTLGELAVLQDGRPAAQRREMMDELIERLRTFAHVKTDEPLSRHTTFGIGGPAEIFVTVRNARELMQAVNTAREFEASFFVLGSGSNILVSDAGIRGVVIDNQAKGVEGPRELAGENVLRAESGASFAALARNIARRGYGGIEWAAGIPGTIGGAVVYNAGAYGGCIGDVLRSITIVDIDGAETEVEAQELRLTYRNSVFTRGEFEGRVVLSAELVLRREESIGLVRRTIPDALRGRLASIELLSYSSGPLLGNAESGLVAALFGVRASVVSGDVLCVLGCALGALLLPGFRAFDDRRTPPP